MKRNLHRSLIAALLILCPFTIANAETLREAIEYTLSTAPDVMIPKKSRLATDELVKQARAGYFPKLDIALGYGREKSVNPTIKTEGRDSRTLTREETAIILRQNIFQGFATKNEVKRRKAQVNSAAYDVNDTIQDIALRVTEVYLGVLENRELLKIAKNNLEAHKRTYSMISKRTESGLARQSDLVQVKGRLALARANMQSAQGNLIDAETNYLRTVGKRPGKLVKPKMDDDMLPKSDEESVQMALDNHPTLKSAKYDIDETHAQRGAARSKFWPQLDFELSTSHNHHLDGVKGSNNDYLAMLKLNYNIFNGGADRARVQETAYQIEEATEIQNRTYRQVIENMKLSWNSLVTSRIRLVNLKIHAQSSRSTVISYRKQFTLGQRTLLDLLDSENEHFESQVSYVGGLYTESFSKMRVFNAMGKLSDAYGVVMPDEAMRIWLNGEGRADAKAEEEEDEDVSTEPPKVEEKTPPKKQARNTQQQERGDDSIGRTRISFDKKSTKNDGS